jgi:aminoglycoside/choline kinase family phosphotransferase
MPERLQQLEQWLELSCRIPHFQIEPASADASFRRYFRVSLPEGRTMIAMDAPPEKEDCRPFVAIAGRMAAAGLHVPKIYADDLRQGFLLLEDLGSESYLDLLDEDSAPRLYGDAIHALVTLQAEVASLGLPGYDRAMLLREMALFPEWLLGRHLGLVLSDEERAMLDSAFEVLIDSALEQPRVFVHRDYHSRNLMVVDHHNPGIIDFQDAVAGPLTYDLVSLLRDCYIEWPLECQLEWVEFYRQSLAGATGRETDAETLLRWFDLMGVQRHLKAAGIFARLNHRDGKPGYLADIPRTLGYIVEVGGRRDAIRPLADFIGARVLPLL